MGPRWLLAMSMWARRPPSAQRVKFVLVIVAICFALLIIERTIGWPDALTVNRMRR